MASARVVGSISAVKWVYSPTTAAAVGIASVGGASSATSAGRAVVAVAEPHARL